MWMLLPVTAGPVDMRVGEEEEEEEEEEGAERNYRLSKKPRPVTGGV